MAGEQKSGHDMETFFSRLAKRKWRRNLHGTAWWSAKACLVDVKAERSREHGRSGGSKYKDHISAVPLERGGRGRIHTDPPWVAHADSLLQYNPQQLSNGDILRDSVKLQVAEGSDQRP